MSGGIWWTVAGLLVGGAIGESLTILWLSRRRSEGDKRRAADTDTDIASAAARRDVWAKRDEIISRAARLRSYKWAVYDKKLAEMVAEIEAAAPKVRTKVLFLPSGGWAIGEWTADLNTFYGPSLYSGNRRAWGNPPREPAPVPGFGRRGHTFDTKAAAQAWMAARRKSKSEDPNHG